jgi:hypothetical protein
MIDIIPFSREHKKRGHNPCQDCGSHWASNPGPWSASGKCRHTRFQIGAETRMWHSPGSVYIYNRIGLKLAYEHGRNGDVLRGVQIYFNWNRMGGGKPRKFLFSNYWRGRGEGITVLHPMDPMSTPCMCAWPQAIMWTFRVCGLIPWAPNAFATTSDHMNDPSLGIHPMGPMCVRPQSITCTIPV